MVQDTPKLLNYITKPNYCIEFEDTEMQTRGHFSYMIH